MELSAVGLIAAAIGFGLLCVIALWRNRAGAMRDPYGDLPSAATKLERIRAYRQQTGVGLKDARLAIEAQDRGQALPEHVLPTASGSDADLMVLVHEGRVIEAIKLYRARTGASLVEAKQAIDRLREGK